MNTYALSILSLVLAACTTSTPPSQPKPAADSLAAPAIAAEPPERSCDDLQRDAHAVVGAHNACTTSADCAVTAAACPGGFACGVPVSAKGLAQVNSEVAALSQRFEAQCKHCVSKHVRCRSPNPVCHEGKCVHAADPSVCDALDRQAEALVQKHNACTRDDECVFARPGGCPAAFACSVSVRDAEVKAFVEAADPLSATYQEYCGRCLATVAECQAAEPFCDKGRCSRRDPQRKP